MECKIYNKGTVCVCGEREAERDKFSNIIQQASTE